MRKSCLVKSHTFETELREKSVKDLYRNREIDVRFWVHDLLATEFKNVF